MGLLATLCLLLLGTAPEEVPLPGPPAETAPPGAATARPGNARKLSHPEREPEDAALLVPRAVLAIPRYVLTGVFWPVAKVLHFVDDPVLARIRRVFLWNREETLGWRPSLQFQGGYGLSGGVRIFHEDLFGNGEELDVEAIAGGLFFQSYQLRFHGDRVAGTRVYLDTRGRYDVSPRLVFAGLGDPSPERSLPLPVGPRDTDIRTRYSQTRGLAALGLGYDFGHRGRTTRPGIGFVYNHRRFGPERRRRGLLVGPGDAIDPSIEDVYDVERLVGFGEGVDVVRLHGTLELDWRNHRGITSEGFRFVALAGGAPPQLRNVAFAHYGGELTGYFNLFHHTRVFVTRIGLEAVHGDERRIPFSELPRLGGPLRLRGYRLNRFRDRRAVFATLEYRYPIHDVVAGHLFVDGGRVASRYRDLVSGDVRPWHVGYGGGFTFRTLNRWMFRVDLSYGEDFLVFFSTDALQAFADRHTLEL